MNTPRSTSLFHFTEELSTLTSILKNGFFPRYSLEDTSWANEERYPRLAFPMVCFCDIPIGRITEHLSSYGSYGLGMSRKWAHKNNLNPVFYVVPESPLAQDYTAAIMTVLGPGNPTNRGLSMLAHAKPTYGIGKGGITKTFYQESEWRYVPRDIVPLFITEKEYDNAEVRGAHNQSAEAFGIRFTQQEDIRYIFVPNDNDIPELIDLITNDQNLGFRPFDRKLLTSRITSLENLRADV